MSNIEEADIGLLHELRISFDSDEPYRFNVLVQQKHGILVTISFDAFCV